MTNNANSELDRVKNDIYKLFALNKKFRAIQIREEKALIEKLEKNFTKQPKA